MLKYSFFTFTQSGSGPCELRTNNKEANYAVCSNFLSIASARYKEINIKKICMDYFRFTGPCSSLMMRSENWGKYSLKQPLTLRSSSKITEVSPNSLISELVLQEPENQKKNHLNNLRDLVEWSFKPLMYKI